jgi:thiol-disulfide isomerase/thioredoxin
VPRRAPLEKASALTLVYGFNQFEFQRATLLPGDTELGRFELPSASGPLVEASRYLGKAVLIEFWETWCGSCLKSVEQAEVVPSLSRTTARFVVDKRAFCASRVRLDAGQEPLFAKKSRIFVE